MATKQWMPKTRDELKKLVDGGVSLNDIETIFVDDMWGLFENSTRTDFSGIEEWNVGNVENMYAMFRGAKHFNTNINSWNVSKVRDMESMFEGAESFNQPLDKWNVSNVRSFDSMFKNAKAFNQNINSWIFSQSDEKYEYYEHKSNEWITIYGIRMDSMFEGAESFNQPLDKWDTSNVKNMAGVFKNAKAFNQNINSWNVGGVFLKEPEKRPFGLFEELEKPDWNKQLNKMKNLFAGSPLEKNPPQWYKQCGFEEFEQKYKERVKRVENFFYKKEKEEEEKAKRKAEAEAEEKAKKAQQVARQKAEMAKRQAEQEIIQAQEKLKTKDIVWGIIGIIAILAFIMRLFK